MTLTVELPLDIGELVEKGLDKARDNEVLDIPDLADTAWSTRQADAFVNMVRGFLEGSGDDNRAPDNYLVTVHVNQRATKHWEKDANRAEGNPESIAGEG